MVFDFVAQRNFVPFTVGAKISVLIRCVEINEDQKDKSRGWRGEWVALLGRRREQFVLRAADKPPRARATPASETRVVVDLKMVARLWPLNK